jgi:hypothetical protein
MCLILRRLSRRICFFLEDLMSRGDRNESLGRTPKWLALILGFGALFAGDARADRPDVQSFGTAARPANELGARFDEVLIRTEGEKIYFSQGGSAFEELPLGDTPEAIALRELLRQADAGDAGTAASVGSFIVANGGPSIHGAKPKKRAKKKDEPKPEPASNPGPAK